MWTATLVLQLVDEGLVDLDASGPDLPLVLKSLASAGRDIPLAHRHRICIQHLALRLDRADICRQGNQASTEVVHRSPTLHRRRTVTAATVGDMSTTTTDRSVMRSTAAPRMPASHRGNRLRDLVPYVADSDVYMCGPQAASDLVVADSLACGTPANSIHNERFVR